MQYLITFRIEQPNGVLYETYLQWIIPSNKAGSIKKFLEQVGKRFHTKNVSIIFMQELD